MAYGGNYDPHKGRGYKWGGVTNGGDKKSTTDTSNSNPGGGTTSSRDIRREVGKKAVDNDFGWGDIGDLARDFLDGVGYAVGDGLRSLGFGDPNPAQQAANMDRQRGVTGARSGGPGQDRERIKQNPQTPQTPFAPAASAPASSPAALRTAADLQNYLSDLQRIAIGNADAQEALARFGIAPEQSMFSYRESFPEFGDSMSNLSLPEIIKRFGNMSPNPEPFAEGGRVGNNTDARGDERVRPRPDSGVSTDLAKFGDMLRDLMMITPETDGRGIENPFGAPDKPQARRPQALRPQDPRPQEPSQITPGGLMPRDLSIDVSRLLPLGMSRERTQRERELSRPRNQLDVRSLIEAVRNDPDITEVVSPGMSRERTQRERELSRPRNQLDVQRLMESVRNEPPSSLFDFNDAEDLKEQDPAVYNDLVLDQGYMNPQNITEAAYPGMSPDDQSLRESVRNEPASSLVDFNDAEDLEEQDPAVYNDLVLDQGDTQTQMWNFISRLEGSETEGYVVRDNKDPNKALGQSGVAIATGLDFGQHDEQSLRNMGLTEDLIERFRPYLGKQGDLAISFLADNPLTITDEENKFIQNKLNEYEYNNLRRIWNSSEDTSSSFEELTPEQQTVLLSVYRQYGNLATETPIFWAAASSGDWDEATAELRDFKGPTQGRRDQEADLLDNGFLYAHGGPVSSRNRALPLVEGDHVVPAHAVKGNESGLAALSKKLMDNQNYNGMISGPGGPRDDAIKTRVYAAGGGISGKMDNLQNPFNSVPARVSNKEYVIPRDAITNLGMMNGAQEGDANKVGQDMIYQLVEHLKRKT
jgi:hypothetical protein